MNNIFEIIFKNILYNISKDNSNIIFIINNEFNPLEEFSHIIKKKNINIFLIIDNINISSKILENIKGEECEKNIHIYNNIDDIYDISNKNIIFDIINIFNLLSNNYLNNILNQIKKISNIDTLIYLYCSLTNKKNIYYKNLIREQIIYYLNNIGYVLYYDDILNIIKNSSFNIKSLNIYKKNNYIFYGDNSMYEIILSIS